MRRLAVLLLVGAATCRPGAAPGPNDHAWIDLGPAPPVSAGSTLGPVTRPDTPAPKASPAPEASPPEVRVEPILHTGVTPPRTPILVLPQDAVVAAHGPRTLPYAAWPSTTARPTVTARFLSPEHIQAARRGLADGCAGDKPRTVKVGDDIRLDTALPYKFGAACLELTLDGYPTARGIVQSTDLSVTVRYDLDAAHVLVTSMQTGEPLAVDLRLFGSGPPLWSGTTNADGYAALPGVRKLSAGLSTQAPLTLVASAGEDFVSTTLGASDKDSYLGAYAGLPAPPPARLEAYLTSGRDHFFAGETVVVQGLVRRVSPHSVDTVPDEVAPWTATALDGEPLVTQGRANLVGGAFQVECPLPAAVSPGPLRFRFMVAGVELGHTVDVVEEVDGLRATVSGTGLTVEVRATEAAELKLRARAVPASPAAAPGWQLGPAELGDYVPASAPRRAVEDLGTLAGRVGPETPWTTQLAAPTGEGPWEIEVDVEVAAGGRPIRLRHRSRVDPAELHGIDAPAVAKAGPCPTIRAARFAGSVASPVPAQLFGPDQRETDDCMTPGDYRVVAGATSRWMLVYGSAAPAEPIIVPTADGLVIGLPRPTWRGLLTLERGGVVHARPLESAGPWTRVVLPDLRRWAPSVTATLTTPRSQQADPVSVRKALTVDASPHRLGVSITTFPGHGALRGIVATENDARVQVLCVDAGTNAAVDGGPLARFRHAWGDSSLLAAPWLPRASAPAELGEAGAGLAPSPTPVALSPVVTPPAVPSTGVAGVAVDGELEFACPVPRSGRVTVLARASTRDRFGAARAEVQVDADTSVPAPHPESPVVGASLAMGPVTSARVDTVSRGAGAVEIVVGNSALAAIVEPLRALLRGGSDLRGAAGRLVALSAGKPIVVYLDLPGLGSPAAVHDATRRAVRAVLRHQRDDGSFGGTKDSVDATMALLLAQESGTWVSPRALETALRHLHRFHVIVPTDQPDRDSIVWRAWMARRISGADDPPPDVGPSSPVDEIFLAARDGRAVDPSPLTALRNTHGRWTQDELWTVLAWNQFARATTRPPGEARAWVAGHGALHVVFRGKTPEFRRVFVPVQAAGADPAVIVAGPAGTWCTVSLTIE